MLFNNDFYRPFNELSRMILGEVAHPWFHENRFRNASPRLNLYEDGDRFVLEAAVPGISPDSLKIKVEDNTLTIEGDRPAPEGMDKVLQAERSFGSFARKIRLSEHVNREAIQAEYENGILTVMLPKAEQAKPRQIEVKVK